MAPTIALPDRSAPGSATIALPRGGVSQGGAGGGGGGFPSNWLGVDASFLHFGKDATASTWPASGLVAGGRTLTVINSGASPTPDGAGPSNTNYTELDGSTKVLKTSDAKIYAETSDSSYGSVASCDFAIEFVIKAEDAGNGYAFLLQNRAHGVSWPGWLIGFNGGANVIRMRVDDTSEYNSGVLTIATKWQHWLWLHDDTNSKAQFYVNGVASGALHTVTSTYDNATNFFESTGPVGAGENAFRCVCNLCMIGIYKPASLDNADFATLALARYNDLFSGDPDGP